MSSIPEAAHKIGPHVHGASKRMADGVRVMVRLICMNRVEGREG